MTAAAAPSRILVATDLGEAANEALRQAHAVALADNAPLGVCHVVPKLGVHMLFPQLYAPEAVGETALSQRAAEVVASTVMSVTGRPADGFHVFIEQGTPYAEIVRRAESWRATLLVVGGHVRAGAAAALLGDVAERVVRYASCTVLVARRVEQRGLVLATTDLSEPSLAAVARAAVEARRRGASLAVLHVIDQGIPLASIGPSMGLTPVVPSPEMLADVRRAVHERLDQFVAKLGVATTVTVVEGTVTSTILEHVARQRPELVVVGTHGHTGLARIALGSIAEHVVRAVRPSVLVVRA